MTTTTSAATATSVPDPADYDDDALDRLADLLAERLAVRLSGLTPARAEPLVDAAEIARLHGKTRTWVYEHAGELDAVRLGSGPRPRLAFSPARVAERLEKVERPTTAPFTALSVFATEGPRRVRRCCMCAQSRLRPTPGRTAPDAASPRRRGARPHSGWASVWAN